MAVIILGVPHVIIIYLLISSSQFLRWFFFSGVFGFLPGTFGGNVE